MKQPLSEPNVFLSGKPVEPVRILCAMNRPCLFVAVLLCLLEPADRIHAQRAEAWTGSLFHEPAGVMGMPRMQEALKGIEYGTALTLDLEAFHALRNNDADRFALTLPLPEGHATAGSNELNFQAERFFVHPAYNRGSDRRQGVGGSSIHPQAPDVQTPVGQRRGRNSRAHGRPCHGQLSSQWTAIRFGPN